MVASMSYRDKLESLDSVVWNFLFYPTNDRFYGFPRNILALLLKRGHHCYGFSNDWLDMVNATTKVYKIIGVEKQGIFEKIYELLDKFKNLKPILEYDPYFKSNFGSAWMYKKQSDEWLIALQDCANLIKMELKMVKGPETLIKDLEEANQKLDKIKEDKFREAFGDGYALGYDRGAKDLLEVKDELEIAYKEADRLRSKIDNILANQEVLNSKPQEEICGDCGSSRSNHPYRHCFRPFKTDEGILDVRQFR